MNNFFLVSLRDNYKYFLKLLLFFLNPSMIIALSCKEIFIKLQLIILKSFRNLI